MPPLPRCRPGPGQPAGGGEPHHPPAPEQAPRHLLQAEHVGVDRPHHPGRQARVVEEVAGVVARDPHARHRRAQPLTASVRARSAAPTRPASLPSCAATMLRLGAVAAAGQLAAERLTGGAEQQVTGGTDPAADDEHAGVERGGEVGHADAEPAADLREQLAGELVAVAGGLGDERAGEVLRPPLHPVEQVGDDRAAGRHQPAGLAHQRVAGGVLLPAALVAALAADAVGHHLHVPELAGDAEAPADDAPAQHDAAADAGAEVDHDQVALAAAGAEAVLGPDRGVGVVVDEDRQRHPLAQGLAQRLVAPGEVRREDDGGPVGGDEPRGPDADRRDVVGAALEQLLDDRDDGVLDHPRGGRAVRGVAPGANQHRAVGVDDAAGHLGAADVDADRERAVSHGVPPGGRRRH